MHVASLIVTRLAACCLTHSLEFPGVSTQAYWAQCRSLIRALPQPAVTSATDRRGGGGGGGGGLSGSGALAPRNSITAQPCVAALLLEGVRTSPAHLARPAGHCP